MKTILSAVLIASFFFTQCGTSSKDAAAGDSSNSAAKTETPKAAIEKIDFYGQQKSLKEVIAATYAAGRTPVVYFWAGWCAPCGEFKQSLPDPLMQDALNNVTLIMVDTDVDDVKEKHGSAFGVSGIPAFVKVDKEGNYVDLVDGGAWDENIPANMAPVLKAFLAGKTAETPAN